MEFPSKRLRFLSLLLCLQQNAGFPSLLLWIPEVIFYEDSRHKEKAGNAFCLYPLLLTMFALHGVLRTHTEATDYLNRLPVSAALTSDKCKIIPPLQQMLVFSIFHMYMQQSISILYPNNVKNAGEFNILLYKFSLNPPSLSYYTGFKCGKSN